MPGAHGSRATFRSWKRRVNLRIEACAIEAKADHRHHASRRLTRRWRGYGDARHNDMRTNNVKPWIAAEAKRRA